MCVCAGMHAWGMLLPCPALSCSSSGGPVAHSFPSPSLSPPFLQINVANVDANGVYTQGDFKAIALAGYIRAKGEADSALTELVKKADSEQ